jgi:hypothetical protein
LVRLAITEGSSARDRVVQGSFLLCGSVAALAVQGALADPRGLPVAIPVDARGRFVRLTQLGRDREMWWSIAELSVQGR